MNKTLVTAALLLVTTGAGCTGVVDKSGGDRSPTTLVLASADGTAPQGALERFVKSVRDQSRGELEVEVSSAWQTEGEQRVLEDVAAGRAELGWSGTRAFDLMGVTAFRSLHAPFVIRTHPQQAAVLRDAVTQDMLSGLDGSGLVGLAVFADELRFPVAAEGPLLDAGDFEGIAFGVMPSEAQTAAMTVLGARVEPLGNLSSTGLYGLAGAETMWSTYLNNGQQDTFPFVTANATLWPRTTALVANAAALAELSSGDRDVLAAAAAETAQWSLAHADDAVAQEMARACEEGARIAVASDRQLDSLTQASTPVYAALKADPQQRTVLGRIMDVVEEVGDAQPLEVPPGCAYRPGDQDRVGRPVLPAPLDGPGETGGLPTGTYRYSLTGDEIREGSGLDDPDYVASNAGVWTWTLDDGRWSYVLKPAAQGVDDSHGGFTCEGYYDVHGDRVDFTTTTVPPGGGDCASTTWKADWRTVENGLAMDVTTDSPDLDFLFGAKTWQRIG